MFSLICLDYMIICSYKGHKGINSKIILIIVNMEVEDNKQVKFSLIELREWIKVLKIIMKQLNVRECYTHLCVIMYYLFFIVRSVEMHKIIVVRSLSVL